MKIEVDLANAEWAKNSLGNGNGANCLEVTFIDGIVALRDSKDGGDLDAKTLIIPQDDYRAFTGGISKGELLFP